MTAQRWLIQGRVQGVGYRDWMVTAARKLGVAGWVRNLPDGTVEALVAGDEPTLGSLFQACRHGPALAAVTDVEVSEAELPHETLFMRR